MAKKTGTWKQFERDIAALTGGERVGPCGEGESPDVRHPWMAIECKYRKTIPQWILHGLEQAERSEGVPIEFIKQKGMSIDESLVVMRIRDFKAFMDLMEKKEDEEY